MLAADTDDIPRYTEPGLIDAFIIGPVRVSETRTENANIFFTIF